jgi:hypothetical protein
MLTGLAYVPPQCDDGSHTSLSIVIKGTRAVPPLRALATRLGKVEPEPEALLRGKKEILERGSVAALVMTISFSVGD